MTASFIVSLDFELHWGIRDHTPLDQVRGRLLRARAGIPVLLDVFREFDIHATWATVGFLFAESHEELLHHAPKIRPAYPTALDNPYTEKLGKNEADDPFHFAPSLIRAIQQVPNQEIATHTFSHYYANEEWADAASLDADFRAATSIAKARGVTLQSVVMPRNQVGDLAVAAWKRAKLAVFRGNPSHWEWKSGAYGPAQRALRLADSYFPIRAPEASRPATQGPTDVTATRFLRPVGNEPVLLWRARTRRILREMTLAAKNGLPYHLWWHPHNFGSHLQANMTALRMILQHQRDLDKRYGMPSLTMAEAAERLSA